MISGTNFASNICMKRVATFITLLVGLLPLESYQSGNAIELMKKMFASIENLQTLHYNLISTERVNNKMMVAKSEIKVSMQPRMIYFKNPDKKVEVLYIDGLWGGDACVNPGKFPYVNLYLNPLNSIMRKGQHHTLFELGFHHISRMIKQTIERTPNHSKHFSILGDARHDGRDCYRVYFHLPEFKITPYVVKKSIKPNELAIQEGIAEYRLYELNPSLAYHSAIPPGTVLKMPNQYGDKMILYIDKKLLLPVLVKVHDPQGLYESYEFYNLQVNPKLSSLDFSKANPSYNF